MSEESYSRDELISNELEDDKYLANFDDCQYYLTIPVLSASIKSSRLKFDSIIIQTRSKGEEKKPVCITLDRKDYANIKDREHFGDFVFLLASKLKYDLLCEKLLFDKAGFLHYEQIARLIEDERRRTSLPRTIYTSLKRLVRWAKEAQTDKAAKQEYKEHLKFLNRIFFEPSQLWHLLCYVGNTSNMNLVWWLNIPAENILFKDETGKDIDRNVLEPLLGNLFPPHCMSEIENSKKKELEKIIDRNSRARLAINAQKEQKEKLQKEIVANTQRLLQLKTPVLEINPEKNQNLFRFEYRWTKLLGRNEEMERLYKFINYEGENLLWWAIVGKGGVGKSRLVLELCLELEKKNWHSGFLADTQRWDMLHEWQPSKPTLVVVDYTFEKAKKLGEYISNAYEKSKQWNHPLRILFLERNAESKALEQFFHPSREIIQNNTCYSKITNTNEKTFLKLDGLNSKIIGKIVDEVFNIHGITPSENTKKLAQKLLAGAGYENRPLYAMFVADACTRNKDARNWGTDRLHQSIFEHNKKIWEEAGIDVKDENDRKHINLLTMATMINGVDIKSIEYEKCLEQSLNGQLNAKDVLPAKHEFYNDKYRVLSDNDIDEKISPLLPDVLGEYFVLRRWKDSLAEECQMELLTKIAWQYKPLAMIDFISRVAQDFPEHEAIDGFVASLLSSEKFHLEKAYILFNLVTLYGQVKQLNKAVSYYNTLDNLAKRYGEDKGIKLQLANATGNLIAFCSKCGRINQALEYYNVLEGLKEDRYQQNSELFIVLAHSLLYLVHNFSKIKEHNKATKYYNRLIDLWKSGYQQDKEISLQVALAASTMVYNLSYANKTEEAVCCYKNLKNLWEGYWRDREISRVTAWTILYITEGLRREGQLNKSAEYYKDIENLWRSGYQQDEEIARLFAQISRDIICDYAKSRNPHRVIDYHKCFESLFVDYPQNETISLLIAETCGAFIYSYTKIGEIDKTIGYYNFVENLWKEKYETNRQLSLVLAKATLHLIYGYVKTRNEDKAVAYLTRLERVWRNYQDDKEISINMAKAARICSRLLNIIGLKDSAENYTKIYKELCNKFFNNRE